MGRYIDNEGEIETRRDDYESAGAAVSDAEERQHQQDVVVMADMVRIAKENERLRAEVERLTRGDFTSEESKKGTAA